MMSSSPRDMRAEYARARSYAEDPLLELGDLHAAVRRELRDRGLVPGSEHHFEREDQRVWVMTRASGRPVAGTVVDGNVVLEALDRTGRRQGTFG